MIRPFVLIIENDPVLGAIFNEALENAGFDTALDIGGCQYVSTLVTRHPAMVVLDLNLPDNLGEQILDDLRDLYPVWALPLVLVTEDLFQAWDLRAKGETVLIKPIIPAQLMDIASRIQDMLKGALE
jgi:DNA-binding response OmpR family regulator